MPKYLTLLLIIFLLTRCGKSSTNPNAGVYKEVTPVAGQTTLQFLDSSHVLIDGADLYDPSITEKKTIGYHIEGTSISFFPMPNSYSDTIGFYFTSSGNTIHLSSCAPGIPCFAAGKDYVFSK